MSPGQLDRDVVRRHLIALDDALQTLRLQRGLPIEVLSTDRQFAWAVERGLQLCAQNALNVATHLVATAGHDAADYATALDQLGRMGVLPKDFLARFRGIAGFRNVLVHGYLSVEVKLVHDLLNNRLEDFAEFAVHVETYLETGNGK